MAETCAPVAEIRAPGAYPALVGGLVVLDVVMPGARTYRLNMGPTYTANLAMELLRLASKALCARTAEAVEAVRPGG